MSSLSHHKRVEFTELFYDLVFVYAISKTTALIHHLHHGIVSFSAIAAFLVTILILVNTWMIQTVFTNRYGKNSFFNIIVSVINMAMLLLISSMISNDWQGYFNYFCWTVGILTLTLFLQYLIQYFKHESTDKDKSLILSFLTMTGLRTLASFVAALFPLAVGYPLFITGIVVSFLMPIVYRKRQSLVSINFPHLIERISLFVIITFGEMIMGIAPFFTPETFGIRSVLIFSMITLLFLYYFGQFDHAIDDSTDTQGLFLIYSHYPIFIGLLMTAVSITFLTEQNANHLFAVLFLYTGLIFFQTSVLSNTIYNKPHVIYSKNYIALQLATTFVAAMASILAAANSTLVLCITTACLFLIETYFLFYYTKGCQKAGLTPGNWF